MIEKSSGEREMIRVPLSLSLSKAYLQRAVGPLYTPRAALFGFREIITPHAHTPNALLPSYLPSNPRFYLYTQRLDIFT